MSWNYPGAGPPPNYGGYPGSGAPGLGPPPAGMHAAPGVGPAPGMAQAQGQTQAQGGFPPNFNPATQMPNINFSAPVIRLGTTGPSKGPEALGGGRRDDRMEQGARRGTGLGYDRGVGSGRDGGGRPETIAIAQPTREEIARTIFVGNITDAMGQEDGLQQMLNAAGGLRRWTRAIDGDGKPCTFGFAEYEDADSLANAAELLKEVKIPTKRPQVNGATKSGDDDEDKKDDGEESGEASDTLLVVIDENSQKYIEDWRARGALKDPAETQFVLDQARETLANLVANLARSNLAAEEGDSKTNDTDVKMEDAEGLGEIVNITIPQGEDELAEIPAEMRETVAKEIQAFRDRSIRRDMERLRREEEMEAAEKRRAQEGSRVSRLASPPATNGSLPTGPRGAPQGPRAIQGAQLPSDYRKGVTFVNGSSNPSYAYYTAEEEESDLTDEQLEEKRQQRKKEELEKLYLDQERRWLARERQRTAAVEREKNRDENDALKIAQRKEEAAQRLRDWNDDIEAQRKTEQYFLDRSLWLRSREAFRKQEARQDDADRAAEARENAREQEQRRRDMGMADDFLAQAAEELGPRMAEQAPAVQQPARFKMSLGAAASQRQEQAARGQRRTVAEVEGMLEDEEDTGQTAQRRTLVPLTAEQLAASASLTDEERAQAQRDLASAIPTDAEGLWMWSVPWEHVTAAMIDKDLKPFVEKKIVEYLGVQEDMVVDVALEGVRKHGRPQELVAELEGALEDEAEVLVRKLWRMLIFFAESEKRGLSS